MDDELLKGVSSSMQDMNTSNAGDPPKFCWTNTQLAFIDYVLVYNPLKGQDEKREAFFTVLRNKKIEMEEYKHMQGSTELVFVKLCVPFRVLAKEAERLKVEMALDKGISSLEQSDCLDVIGRCCHLEVEGEEEDYISGAFQYKKLHLFKGYENKATFFRSSLRSYITYNILINADIRTKQAKDKDGVENKELAKIALPKLLHEDHFTDAFIVHDASKNDPYIESLKKEWLKKRPEIFTFEKSKTSYTKIQKHKDLQFLNSVDTCNFKYDYHPDSRKKLDDSWTKIYKYQPLLGVRNYFGEKIAFYFAWSGHMISLLWSPTIFGLVVFLYGLSISIQRRNAGTNSTLPSNATELTKVMKLVDDMLGTIKEAFDNNITPAFAIFICLWGTLHTELWKRYRATLAYEWDVNNYDHSEPDRPEFRGTHTRWDPITGMLDFYYPGSKQAFKFMSSFIIILLMICIVFIGVAAVIVYRVFVTIKFCPTATSVNCLIVNTVVSSVLNAVFIIAIGKVYDKLAYILTNWENHRFQSDYDNALIVKLFAFQFANSYASLFYIAFFRGSNVFISQNGIFGLGPEYVDTCGTDGNCMAMLSIQVLILMLAKPLPKILTDHVLPFVMKIIRLCLKSRQKGQVEDGNILPNTPTDVNAYIVNEYQKFDLGDFTVSEYMEKIIQFGYLMLFASAFPLAPLIALLTNLFDLSGDSYRLLWVFRRPVAHISSDIGMWADIVEFLNIAGVISNAFIIAFTASWTKDYPDLNSTQSRLIIVLIVENAVLGLKYFISAVIPDVPRLISLQIRREQYRVPKILAGENIDSGDEDENENANANNNAADGLSESKRHKKKKRRRRHKRGEETEKSYEDPSKEDVSEDEDTDIAGPFGSPSYNRRRRNKSKDNAKNGPDGQQFEMSRIGRHDTTDLVGPGL